MVELKSDVIDVVLISMIVVRDDDHRRCRMDDVKFVLTMMSKRNFDNLTMICFDRDFLIDDMHGRNERPA